MGNYNYTPSIISILKEHGLSSESEIEYTKNVITNAFRRINDNCDNFRLSINGMQDEEYEERKADGCCGFYDKTIKLNSGIIVKFGFNFGH